MVVFGFGILFFNPLKSKVTDLNQTVNLITNISELRVGRLAVTIEKERKKDGSGPFNVAAQHFIMKFKTNKTRWAPLPSIIN